jgi:general secretion pathway protein L
MQQALRTAWQVLDSWLEGPASLLAERWQAGRRHTAVEARLADDGTALALRSTGKGGSAEASLPLQPGGDRQAQAGALAQLVKGQRVVLIAPRAWVIERRIELPQEAGDHLEGIVAARVASLSPLPVQDMLYGHGVAGNDSAARRMRVDIALLPKARVGPVIDLLESAGARQTEVVAQAQQGARIVLYPRRAGRTATLGRIKLGLGLLLSAAIASMLVAFGVTVAHGMYRSGQQADLEIRAAAARATISELMTPQTAGTAPEQAAIDIKNEAISALGALDDLAAALPVHSFATEIALAEGRLRLAGRTFDLPDVLTALESSGRFADSALVGPAVRGEDERSSLFTLETRPLIRSGGELK